MGSELLMWQKLSRCLKVLKKGVWNHYEEPLYSLTNLPHFVKAPNE